MKRRKVTLKRNIKFNFDQYSFIGITNDLHIPFEKIGIMRKIKNGEFVLFNDVKPYLNPRAGICMDEEKLKTVVHNTVFSNDKIKSLLKYEDIINLIKDLICDIKYKTTCSI